MEILCLCVEGTLPGLSGGSRRLHLLVFPAFKATSVSLPFCRWSVCPCPMTLTFPFVSVAGCVVSVANRKVADRRLLASGRSTGITIRDPV